MNKIDLVKMSAYLDGGTTVWIRPEVKANIKTREEAITCEKFYLDKRVHSTTKGELFDRYPSKEGRYKALELILSSAVILPVEESWDAGMIKAIKHKENNGMEQLYPDGVVITKK